MCIHGYVESEFCIFPTDCTSSQSIIVGELKVQRNAEIINTTSFDYPSLIHTHTLKVSVHHLQKLVGMCRTSLCRSNALGLAFQRFLESG